jgi:hypothetical protein
MGLDWIDCGAEGKIRFSGVARGGDELGHNTFEVSLPNRTSGLFGEYEYRFAENDNDFDIEVVRFGYFHRTNVDNLHPDAREKISSAESTLVQHLVSILMNNPDAQKGISGFSSKKGRFLGQIYFAPGWVKLNK